MPYVLFEVKYFWNDWIKKDGVNDNLVSCDWPNFRFTVDTPIDSAFSLLLRSVYFFGEMQQQRCDTKINRFQR